MQCCDPFFYGSGSFLDMFLMFSKINNFLIILFIPNLNIIMTLKINEKKCILTKRIRIRVFSRIRATLKAHYTPKKGQTVAFWPISAPFYEVMGCPYNHEILGIIFKPSSLAITNYNRKNAG